MRNLLKKIALTVATLMIMVVPVLSDDSSVVQPRGSEQLQGGKEQCLIMAMNCGDRAQSIQHRIDMLQTEINKGLAGYTNEELNILRNQLDAEKNELDRARVGGA